MDAREQAFDLADAMVAANRDVLRAKLTTGGAARERADAQALEAQRIAGSLLESTELAVAVLARLAHDLAGVALMGMPVEDDRLARAVLDRRATENSLANAYARQAMTYAFEQASGDESRGFEADRQIDEAHATTAVEQTPQNIVRAALALAVRVASLELADEAASESPSERLSKHELAAWYMRLATSWPVEQFI